MRRAALSDPASSMATGVTPAKAAAARKPRAAPRKRAAKAPAAKAPAAKRPRAKKAAKSAPEA